MGVKVGDFAIGSQVKLANGIDPVEERKAQKLAQQLLSENSFEAKSRELHANKADRWTLAYPEGILKPLNRMFSCTLATFLYARLNLWNCLKFLGVLKNAEL